MCEDWDAIRSELSEINLFNVNGEIDINFLRQCFLTLLNTTDNVKRQRLENGLKKIASRPEIIFVLSKLILEDADVNVRLYACSYLANSTSRLVETIIEAESSDVKLDVLAKILFMGLTDIELPDNLRNFLIKGLGIFVAKTFPDIWPNAVDRITTELHNPTYVFQCLAAIAQVFRSLPINYLEKQQRETLMWDSFGSIIEPYIMQTLSIGQNSLLCEQLATMLSEWIRLRNPSMIFIRPIVSRIFEVHAYNPRSLSIIISGFNELDSEMVENRMFLCTILGSEVHTDLLNEISRLMTDASAGFLHSEATAITELVHVMVEFYANVLNRASRCFLFQNYEHKTLERQQIIEHMFDFMSRLLALCYRSYNITNAIGVFYSTIQQSLMDEFCKLEDFLAEIMLYKAHDCVFYVFEASIITDGASFESSELEDVMQCRELFGDLFLLVDSLALTAHLESFSKEYAELLATCVSRNDYPRTSAIIHYLRILPLNFDFVDIIVGMNLTWESLNFFMLNDEQIVDFLHNYFEFVVTLTKSEADQDNYRLLIHETVRIALSYLSHILYSKNTPKVTVTDPSQQRTLMRDEENEYYYIKECFRALDQFTSVVYFGARFCDEMHQICAKYYQESTDFELKKVLIKCLANCVSFNDITADKIRSSFFEIIQSKLHSLCFIYEDAVDKAEANHQIVACLKDLNIFCTSFSPNTMKNLSSYVGEILWEIFTLLISHKINPDTLIESFVLFITPEVYGKFALSIPSIVHEYPELVSRVLRASFQHPEEFLLKNVLPVLFDFIWTIAETTTRDKEVMPADQSTLDLLFFLLRRHREVFMYYIQSRSSESSVSYSFADESINRGLRVMELITELQLDEAVTRCFAGKYRCVISKILDLVFSVHFSCVQMNVSKLLYFFSQSLHKEFLIEMRKHKVISLKGAELLMVDQLPRAAIVKQLILWNNAWRQDDK